MKAFGQLDGGRVIGYYGTIGVSDHELSIGVGLRLGSGKRQEGCNDKKSHDCSTDGFLLNSN